MYFIFLSISTAQYFRYFKTIKERIQRIHTASNEKHKKACRRTRRLSSVSFVGRYTFGLGSGRYADRRWCYLMRPRRLPRFFQCNPFLNHFSKNNQNLTLNIMEPRPRLKTNDYLLACYNPEYQNNLDQLEPRSRFQSKPLDRTEWTWYQKTA